MAAASAATATATATSAAAATATAMDVTGDDLSSSHSSSRICTILDLLEDTAYAGPCADASVLEAAVSTGIKSADFRQLCCDLAQSVSSLTGEVCVLSPPAEDDVEGEAFVIDLVGFLKDYGCPHESVVLAPGALESDDNGARLTVLEYLTSELAACRMLIAKHGSAGKSSSSSSSSSKKGGGAGGQSGAAGASGGISSESSSWSSADSIAHVVSVLGLQLPPGASVETVFGAVKARITELCSDLPSDHVPSPLLTHELSPEQWAQLSDLNEVMADEYALRRQMLLRRLDVTVQSFKWSERAKTLLDRIEAFYQPRRRPLTAASSVDVRDVAFAGDDLLRVEKTSNAGVRQGTQTALTKIMIGKVPDRGGRPKDKRPPPAMPRFRARTTGAPKPQRDRGGRGRGSGGGGRGGGKRGKKNRGNRAKGGWEKKKADN